MIVNTDFLETLAAAIANHIPRRIPLSVDLWSIAEIAAYLKVSTASVSDRYATSPDFPKAIRLPSGGPRKGHPRYKAKEVIAWAERHQEKS
jgi:hypothetical protein